VISGDIASVRADAICTSTNPRLSLMMGTGAAVRDRGGYEILRACEAIVAAAGTSLKAGQVHVTTAGTLPSRIIIHCVASDAAHHSSDAIIRSCVTSALEAAAANGCTTIAMPVFASGHAHMSFARALKAMASAFKPKADEIIVVVRDRDRVHEAASILKAALPGVSVTEQASTDGDDEPVSLWSTDAL
jgi:O-acetyl-ADP-ribose deacetylase (regulator of RNase III)